jgi:hypothetical protein
MGLRCIDGKVWSVKLGYRSAFASVSTRSGCWFVGLELLLMV